MNNKTFKIELNKKQIIWLTGALIVTLMLSLYYVIPNLFSTDFGHDEGNYIKMAVQLVENKIYSYTSDQPDAFVPPGLPLFLSACYMLVGFSPSGLATIRIIQVLFSVLTVYLTFVFSSKISKNTSVGLVSAWLITLNLNYYSYTFSFLTENIYFLFMMLFAVYYVSAYEKEKKIGYFFSGMLFCACVMIRSAIFSVVLTMFIPLFIKYNGNYIEAVKRILIFALGFVLLALPWWIRNVIVLGDFIPFCNQPHIVYNGLAEDIYSYGVSQPSTIIGHIKLFFDLVRLDAKNILFWNTFGKFYEIFLHYNNDLNSVVSEIVSCLTLFLGLPLCIKGLTVKNSRWKYITFFIYLLTVFIGVPSQRYSLQFFFFLSVPVAQFIYFDIINGRCEDWPM